MFVTVELLKKLKACKDQLIKFDLLFPSGVELTRELIVRHAQEFNWKWCAVNLAGAAGFDAYRQAEMLAQAAYRRAIAPALAVFWQAEEQAWAAYRRAEDNAQAAYDQAIAPAEAVYQQAEMPAHAAYNLACATAFADALGL